MMMTPERIGQTTHSSFQSADRKRRLSSVDRVMTRPCDGTRVAWVPRLDGSGTMLPGGSSLEVFITALSQINHATIAKCKRRRQLGGGSSKIWHAHLV